MDNQSFLEAIKANPDDEIPRLVYADWLDDQGDPRGELIRVQCEIARRRENDLSRKRLEERASELLEDYGEAWLEPLRERGALGVSVRCFHRGLLEHVKIAAEDFLKHADALCQIEPALTRVQLTNAGPHLKALGEMPFPAQIISLDLSVNRLTANQCRTLAESPTTSQWKTLDLKFNQLENQAVTEICAANWPKLERLDLSSNRLGPESAATLAQQTAFPQLKVLCLSMNRIADQGVLALFRSDSLSNLEELHLASNGITDTAVTQLIKSQGLASLKILSLRYNRIGIPKQKKMLASPLKQRLQELDLTGNERERSY